MNVLTLDMQAPIKSIICHAPNDDYWVVGQRGCTAITYAIINYGTYGIGQFTIWKGKRQHATYTHQAIQDIGWEKVAANDPVVGEVGG